MNFIIKIIQNIIKKIFYLIYKVFYFIDIIFNKIIKKVFYWFRIFRGRSIRVSKLKIKNLIFLSQMKLLIGGCTIFLQKNQRRN